MLEVLFFKLLVVVVEVTDGLETNPGQLSEAGRYVGMDNKGHEKCTQMK